MRERIFEVLCVLTVGGGVAFAQGPGIYLPKPGINVADYGALADAQVSGGITCGITGGMAALSCSNNIFAPSDAGKWIEVPLAGGTSMAPSTLLAQIVAVTGSPTSGFYSNLTLATNAVNTVTT